MSTRAARRSAALGRLARTVGVVTLAGLGVTMCTPLPNVLSAWMSRAAHLADADAIVVLGAGGMGEDGTLSDPSLARAVRGITLARQGLAPLIVFSGAPPEDRPAEADARAALARELGVPEGRILTESGARTTRQEAERIGARLRARGARRIPLVAGREGMGRAVAVFEREGLEVLPAPVRAAPGLSVGPGERLGLLRDVLRELLAWAYYRAAGYL